MSEPFLAEIKIISWNFAPKGWAFCNGQLLPINQNQPLFSILGTVYGGNGQTTFALPDLRGRIPVHVGNGIILGERGGETVHTLTAAELPAHRHAAKAHGGTSGVIKGTPAGNVWGYNASIRQFNGAANATMMPQAIGTVGGSQPHENMPPYLVLNYIIALQGIFPSRN
jgi:microcystin-dependent protein